MSITGDVLKYLQDKNGKHCFVTTMSDELGYSIQQIRGSINSKRHEDPDIGRHIINVARGNVWYWCDNLPETEDNKTSKVNSALPKNLYEQIGVTKSGDLILQDEDGNLFRATELT